MCQEREKLRRGETSLQDMYMICMGPQSVRRLLSSYWENVSDTDSSELSGRSGPAVYRCTPAALLAPSSGGTYSTGNGATGISPSVGGERPAAYVVQYDIRTVPVMVYYWHQPAGRLARGQRPT